jgi:hypothetical protein
MSKMGKTSRKIVLYESDKRCADLKIALDRDNLAQALFFRYLIQGYINEDKNIMAFIDKIKKGKLQTPKVWERESRMKRLLAARQMGDLSMSDEELQSIFDLIEEEDF